MKRDEKIHGNSENVIIYWANIHEMSEIPQYSRDVFLKKKSKLPVREVQMPLGFQIAFRDEIYG
jgi:hypothetical protein